MNRTEWLAEHAAHVDLSTVRADARVFFNTPEERDAFVARFPKSVGVRSYRQAVLSADCTSVEHYYFGAGIGVLLVANDANGGVNEAGIKRARRFISVLVKEFPNYSVGRSTKMVSVDEFLGAEVAA